MTTRNGWFKIPRKEAIRTEQLNRIEDEIRELKSSGTNVTNNQNEA
jgi:hypothetical protein